MQVKQGLTWNPIKHTWEEPPMKTSEVPYWDTFRQGYLGSPQITIQIKEGMKSDNEKLRLDLLPFDALMEVAQVYTMGAKKYSDRNWERGLQYMRVVGALLRHLFAWILGEERAEDDKQRHLASVVWCGLALLTYELRGMKQFDDRPCLR